MFALSAGIVLVGHCIVCSPSHQFWKGGRSNDVRVAARSVADVRAEDIIPVYLGFPFVLGMGKLAGKLFVSTGTKAGVPWA